MDPIARLGQRVARHIWHVLIRIIMYDTDLYGPRASAHYIPQRRCVKGLPIAPTLFHPTRGRTLEFGRGRLRDSCAISAQRWGCIRFEAR